MDIPPLPQGWTLAATSFNRTPEMLAAERSAADLTIDMAASGTATVLEIEAGQVWRGFPRPGDAEVDALRESLAANNARVSMVGIGIDEWDARDERRDDEARLRFLEPQLRASARVGAAGVRLPLGQAGPDLLARLQPLLHELDLVLYEEIQGQQRADAPVEAAALDTISGFADDRIRVLIDASMIMPALPVTYLEHIDGQGLPDDVMGALRERWAEPATRRIVVDTLRSGAVPPHIHTLYMNLLIRFGSQRAADLRDILPLTGALHLKFWDLDDADGRVSTPLRELGTALAHAGFTGTLCSEWGGHEWLDADATAMTQAHLALAATALAEGAAAAG